MIFLLAGCGQTAVAPTAVPTSTITATPTPTNIPLPTASATIVRIPTQDFTLPSSTPFLLQILVDGETVTPYPLGTPLSPGPGFVTVEYSPKKIYWGGCDPNYALIRAEVEDPDEVISVLLFMRVKDIKDDDYTPWTKGNVMLNRGQGEFTFKMIGTEVRGHDHYLRSWVYFQLVATNIKGEEIGRTRVYQKAIEMYPCPCLTPLTDCPITPVPTKKP